MIGYGFMIIMCGILFNVEDVTFVAHRKPDEIIFFVWLI